MYPVPTVTGAPNLVKLLTQDRLDVTGGVFHVEKDLVDAVVARLNYIESRRKKPDICGLIFESRR